MDHSRAAKLALARKKLKDHQDKKQTPIQKLEEISEAKKNIVLKNEGQPYCDDSVEDYRDNNDAQEPNNIDKSKQNDIDMNVVEILVSNKRNLELQVNDLQRNLRDLEKMLANESKEHNDFKHKTINLNIELQNIEDKYKKATEKIQQLNKKIEELLALKTSLTDENNNLMEQLDLTKTLLTAKQTENAALLSQLNQLQSDLDVSKLQIHQLINGSNADTVQGSGNSSSNHSELLQKLETLENQLKNVQKERDQHNLHYEHYVGEVNQQMQSLLLRNEELLKKVDSLSNREISLIEQISEMEIRMQNMQLRYTESEERKPDKYTDEIQNQFITAQKQLQDINEKYEALQKLQGEKDAKIEELHNTLVTIRNQEHISITKLSADITNDKIAAQRATEQNKKLKIRMQELEEAFVKMSQDKLELTEKVTAEKFLNRELTIKLADSEEKYKNIHVKLRAKDEEMIRLQTSYRDLEKNLENNISIDDHMPTVNLECIDKDIIETDNSKSLEETIPINCEEPNSDSKYHQKHNSECSSMLNSNNCIIPKERAMVKLQQRFLKIMDEVANLSDEKHRLEHIILQLQNETDTICEYVALYQQQRCLLKKRDEERSAQIELFQIECDKLKNQLEELSRILLRFAEDKELNTYFQDESRQKDMEKVRNLLSNLKSNSLVDLKRSNLELSNIYPCSCCSGNLIDI
ncbi:hypothetical protein ACJJTC_014239 [Scirpophaga incertulas]